MSDFVLCNQSCGTRVYFKDGRPYNVRNNKPHECSRAQIAREFEGYYNMIQIGTIKPFLNGIIDSLQQTQHRINELQRTIDYYENQNKPLAEAFVKRKEAGRKRNYQ
jgi:hypothetical protein